jgi:hypothetical protein
MVSRLNSSSPRATQPTNTDVKLKDHQLALLYRDEIGRPYHVESCRDAEEQRTRAERSGTARNQIRTDSQQKCLPSLSPTKPVLGKHSWRYPWCARTSKEKQGCTVVVVPQTILAQWKAVKEFAPNMKCCRTGLYVRLGTDVRRYQYSQRQPLVIVDSLYCDTLASVSTSGTTLHRVIYDEVDTIEVVRRILPANMI